MALRLRMRNATGLGASAESRSGRRCRPPKRLRSSVRARTAFAQTMTLHQFLGSYSSPSMQTAGLVRSTTQTGPAAGFATRLLAGLTFSAPRRGSISGERTLAQTTISVPGRAVRHDLSESLNNERLDVRSRLVQVLRGFRIA